MEDIKFQVIYRNKTYNFEYGSQAYIFHTGVFKNMQKRGIQELLKYVDFVHNCYLKDSNRTPLGALADYVAEHWKQVKDKNHCKVLEQFYLLHFYLQE